MKSRLPDLTLTVCRADALWLEREGRLPADRIRTIANGIGRPAGSSPEAARADLGLPEGGALLGLVGRLSPQKAPERALDLLGRLASSGEAPGGGADPSRRPDWRLVVGGDGPLRPALERSARERGLADRVTWCGARDDAPALLAALDLLLLPSLWEGLPYVLLEALAAGVPVLAAPVGGVPEVLAGESLSSGCLEWDPGSWAERAVRLATSPGGRRAWSAAALRRAGDFGEEAMIDRIEAAYLELPAGA